jgi:hypothetical protein
MKLSSSLRSFSATTALITTSLCLQTMLVSAQTFSVAPVKMNVLYIGVDNPVSVAASTADDNKVTISVDGGGGTATKLDAGLYNVKVTSQTNDCTVNVYVDGKLIGSTKFRVRLLPHPSAAVGGLTSGASVSADALRKQSGIGVYVMNSPFDIKYEVLGFTLVLPGEKGAINTVECEGNVFSPKAKEYLDRYAKPGDIVTIENIRVRGPEGQIKLPALLYNIK